MTGIHIFIVLPVSNMEERDKAKNIRTSGIKLPRQDFQELFAVKPRYTVNARRVTESANAEDYIHGNKKRF